MKDNTNLKFMQGGDARNINLGSNDVGASSGVGNLESHKKCFSLFFFSFFESHDDT